MRGKEGWRVWVVGSWGKREEGGGGGVVMLSQLEDVAYRLMPVQVTVWCEGGAGHAGISVGASG